MTNHETTTQTIRCMVGIDLEAPGWVDPADLDEGELEDALNDAIGERVEGVELVLTTEAPDRPATVKIRGFA